MSPYQIDPIVIETRARALRAAYTVRFFSSLVARLRGTGRAIRA